MSDNPLARPQAPVQHHAHRWGAPHPHRIRPGSRPRSGPAGACALRRISDHNVI